MTGADLDVIGRITALLDQASAKNRDAAAAFDASKLAADPGTRAQLLRAAAQLSEENTALLGQARELVTGAELGVEQLRELLSRI